jgi:hypothetical protein
MKLILWKVQKIEITIKGDRKKEKGERPRSPVSFLRFRLFYFFHGFVKIDSAIGIRAPL